MFLVINNLSYCIINFKINYYNSKISIYHKIYLIIGDRPPPFRIDFRKNDLSIQITYPIPMNDLLALMRYN